MASTTYLCEYGHIEKSIPGFKVKWFTKDDNGLLSSCFKGELPVLVSRYDRVGDVRIRRVWPVPIHSLDAPEDGETDGGVLIYGHVVAWNVSGWCEYDIYTEMLSH